MVHNDGVKVLEFGAFHRFRVTWWMELAKTDYHFIRHVVHQEIWRSLHEQGIEMALPEHPAPGDPPPGRLPPEKLPSGKLPGRTGGMQAHPAE